MRNIVHGSILSLCFVLGLTQHAHAQTSLHRQNSASNTNSHLSSAFTGIKVPPLKPLCRGDQQAIEDRMYYSDGSMYLIAQCKEGKRHGWVRVFRPDGELWSESRYVEDKRHGTEVTYFVGGAIQQEDNYVEGLRDGQRRQYDHSGRPLRDSFFSKGKKVSADISYKRASLVEGATLSINTFGQKQ